MTERIIGTYGRLFTITVLIALSTLAACKKEDRLDESPKCPVSAVNGANDNVIGKWKLIKAKVVFKNQETEDYSCDDIIYDFQDDGVLLISGSSDKAIGYQEGQYMYEFTTERLFEGLEEGYTISINNRKIATGIKNNQLVLNDSPLDGPILYFVRVE